MSETTPKARTPQNPPMLAPLALSAFRALIWFGILILAVAVVAVIVYVNLDDDDLHGMFIWAAITAATIPAGMALIAGAGIVAGLGKREAAKTA